MVYINNVDFSYNKNGESKNLENININVKKGECLLLCGKSGCGKTTILKMVNGLIPHFDSGELDGNISVENMNIGKTPMYEISKKVGSVFQNPKTQFFNIDAYSELSFGLENAGVDRDFIRERMNKSIKDFNLDKLIRRNIFSLSGGEKQLLAIASVYTVNPDIYVLDEPSANLDYKSILLLEKALRKLKAEGKSIIIAEHRLFYLKDLFDRVVYIDNGKIEKAFSKDTFLKSPDSFRKTLGLRALDIKIPKIDSSINEEGSFKVNNLTIKLKNKTIINDLSFSVPNNKVIGIFGENGAGKSTLMRCLSGLIRQNSGSIEYNGKVLKPKARNKLSFMVMQDVNHQLFCDSVIEECKLSLNGKSDVDRIEKLLKDFDLYELKDKHPMCLSGGQKQRLSIVTGLIENKEIIIFDEPTSGLDYGHMCVVSNIIKQLAKSNHIIFVVSHDYEFIDMTCERIIELKKLS